MHIALSIYIYTIYVYMIYIYIYTHMILVRQVHYAASFSGRRFRSELPHLLGRHTAGIIPMNYYETDPWSCLGLGLTEGLKKLEHEAMIRTDRTVLLYVNDCSCGWKKSQYYKTKLSVVGL